MARKKLEKRNLCKCGCGQLVHKDYARGHIHRVTKAMYTEGWKEKVSKASKENNPFKGKHHTEETKEKLRQSRSSRKWSEAERKAYEDNVEKRRLEKESLRTLCACGCGELAEYGNEYIKFHHHRNRSEEVRKNMGDSHKGRPGWNKGKTSANDARVVAGSSHGMWKGGVKLLNSTIRGCKEYKDWRVSVFIRDDYTCRDCCKRGAVRIHAHHLKPFTEILSELNIKSLDDAIKCEKLWNINNGITLCKECHIERHKEEDLKYNNLNGSTNSPKGNKINSM